MKLAAVASLFVVVQHSFGGNVQWGPWSPCSESCGPGFQTRMAICMSGGNSCKNDKGEVREGDIKSQNCNGNKCSTKLVSTQPSITQITVSSATDIDTSPTASTEATRTEAINSTTTMTNTPTKTTTKQIALKSTSKTYIRSLQISSQIHQAPYTPATAQVSQEQGTKFEGTMKMQRPFKKDLTDQSSDAFKDLKKKSETAIKETLEEYEIEGDNECYKFTKGSVMIQYRVNTKNSIKVSKLYDAFSWSTKSGPLHSLLVISFSIKKLSSVSKGSNREEKARDSESETFQSYVYFLYGFGGMIGLAVLFVLVVVTKNKIKPAKSKKEDGEETYESYFNTPVTARKMHEDRYSKKTANAWQAT